MEELEISGRRYISTRRAAREHGYHSDYMGQLIRSKKVAGQKVGRAWYIDEESLAVYLGKAPAPAPSEPAAEDPAPATKEAKAEEVKEDVVPALVADVAPEPMPHKVGAPAVEIEKETAEPLPAAPEQEEHKIVITKPEAPAPEAAPVPHAAPIYREEPARIPLRREPVQEMGGLRYAEDTSPVLPVITRMPQTAQRSHAMPHAAPQPVRVAPPHIEASERKFPVVSLMVVALMTLAVAGFASQFVSAVVHTEQGMPAIVDYAIHW